MSSRSETLEIVVVGGGYGGLEIVRKLNGEKKLRNQARITLIAEDNFFLFTPLLPDITSGSIGTRHIVYPLRSFCAPRGVRFIKNALVSVDTKARRIRLHGGLQIAYDYLFLAMGARPNFYGVPGAAENCLTLKTVNDAVRLRARIIEMFELADQAEAEELKRRLLTFVVVGGGLTGVEIASEMMLLIRDSMRPAFPNLPDNLVTVHVVEAEERLIPQVREEHGAIVEKHLRGLGVRIHLSRQAKRVHENSVDFDDASSISAHTLIWTAGIQGSAPAQGWPDDFPLTQNGKIEVDDEGRVPRHPRVFAVGDLASFRDVKSGDPVPAVAQGAIQGGQVAAQNLLADIGLAEPAKLSYTEYGYIVGLGKRSSVAHFAGITISNWLGWYVWAFVYLIKMVGFQKQLEVMFDHVKSFFFPRDISQIHDRRIVLREGDQEIRLSAGNGPESEADPGGERKTEESEATETAGSASPS